MKRITALALVLLLALGLFAGCQTDSGTPLQSSEAGSTASTASETPASSDDASEAPAATGDVTVSAPGEFPIVTEPVTLKVAAEGTTYIGTLNDNWFAKWYADKTGVTIEYEEIPTAAKEEKVNLMLASNQLPDMFISQLVSVDNVALYGSQGVFLPLNDYIDQQGHYFKAAMEPIADLPGGITSTDGNIYSLPNINECYHCMHSMRTWINTTWLSNLGLEKPTTTDEFTEVLRAFRDNDPNGNGQADEIAMMGASLTDPTAWNNSVIPFLMNSFIYYQHGELDGTKTGLSLDNGTVVFAPNQDAFRDGLLYIRGLIEEGLIDPTSLTQNVEQVLQVGSDPEIAKLGVVPGATWWSVLGADNMTDEDRSREYDGLTMLKGPSGVNYSPKTSGSYSINGLVITSQCQYPEVAFKWADGLYEDEVTLLSSHGEEGVEWEQPDEGAVGINGLPALRKVIARTDDERVASNTWMPNIILSNRSNDFRLGQQSSGDEWDLETRLYNVTKTYYVDNADDARWFPNVALTPDESNEVAMMKTQIKDYVDEQIVLFLSGNRSIENDWDSYVAEYENLGLTRYLEIMQTAYDRQYK
ncbi:MAG: extracellular solute-binding protein [Oscillospiraceae bacterium]